MASLTPPTPTAQHDVDWVESPSSASPLGDLSLPESHRDPLLALQVRDSVESGYFLCIIDRRRGSEASSSARSPTSRRRRSQRRDASTTPRSPSGILHRDALRKAKSAEEIQKLNAELARDRDRAGRDRDRKIEELRKR